MADFCGPAAYTLPGSGVRFLTNSPDEILPEAEANLHS